MQQKIDKQMRDPVVKTAAERYSLRTRLAFLPDDVIGQSWFFRLLTFLYYYFFVFFHAFEGITSRKYLFQHIFYRSLVVGIEKIDPDSGCLFIARHSTHNGDILGTLVCFYHKTGRVLR